MEEGEQQSKETPQQDPSQLSVFVHQANSYIGRHVVSALTAANYQVYGDKEQIRKFAAPNTSPVPHFDVVSGIDEAFALCNTFIFDIREDPSLAVQSFSRFEAATTNIKIVLISTLMTWALTYDKKREVPPPQEGEEGQEEATQPPPVTIKEDRRPLTGDDFRKRKPHPNFRAQYEAELKAFKLDHENPFVTVYILACGIPYGDGEDILFPLMKYAWNSKNAEQNGFQEHLHHVPLIGEGENTIPMIHVRDLASLLVATLQGQMIDKFVMAVDKSESKLKDVVEAISKLYSDGEVQQIDKDQALVIPWMTEATIDYLTADILATNELLARVPMTNANGFVPSIDQIGKEFMESRNVSPMRILVCGPPLSGRTTLAAKISYRYSIPLISVDSLVSEAKKNANGYWTQFATQLQGEISPPILLELMKHKLQDIPCRNQGFILDGIPSNMDFAEALWQDSSNSPQYFIELEGSDAFLRNRAKQDPNLMLGIGNTDEFEARLQQYRQTNGFDEAHLFYAFDPNTIKAITIPIEKVADPVETAMKFIGKPHNFGKPPSLILRDSEEQERQRRIKQERLAKAEAQLREAEEAKKREKELLITRQQEMIAQEETRLLAKFSKTQREWLVSTIAPALAGGLCYLIEEMPEDPIQMLGCYIGETLPPEQKNELLYEFQSDEDEEEEYEEEEEIHQIHEPLEPPPEQ